MTNVVFNRLFTVCRHAMVTPSVGASLQKLNITSSALLACTSDPASGDLISVAVITNGVV